MPNDAKVGLVLGVGLVVLIAVVFFHNDAGSGPSNANDAVSAGKQEKSVPTGAIPVSLSEPIEK